MHLSFHITTTDLTSFILHWSSKYSYSAEHKYTNNIGKTLTKDSLQELFEWKNGTGSVIADRKAKSICKNYPLTFNGGRRERYLNHNLSGGAIWNIFYLHCLDPKTWPIFDQHTFRAMYYIQTGRIMEIGNNDKKKYELYESEYIPFVKNLRILVDDQRLVDKALFAFGQFLKFAGKYV